MEALDIRGMLRARHQPGKDVHRQCDGRTLGPAHWQQRALERFVRVGGRVAILVNRPIRRDGFAAPGGLADFAARDHTGSHIRREKQVPASVNRDGNRVSAGKSFRAAPGSHRRRGVTAHQGNHAFTGDHFRVIRQRTHAIGVADQDEPDPILSRAGNDQVRR